MTQKDNNPVTGGLGISGRIAAFFQTAHITPLLALVAFLLGVFALSVTPREEEPQIDVTMANVMISFPGASTRDVESMVATPAEHVLSRMTGVEHVMSISRPGMAVLTIQFEVGVPRNDALVSLRDTLDSHADWLPQNLGVAPPLLKPMGIDDVPIVSLTLYSARDDTTAFDLERISNSLESEIKRVPGTRDVYSIGGNSRVIMVSVDPVRMANAGITIQELSGALQAANQGMPVGSLLHGNQQIQLEAGPFLERIQDVAELVVAVRDGRPVFLRDIASLSDGPLPPINYVWFGENAADGGQTHPAITLAVTKKPGENAIDVAAAVIKRVNSLHNVIIPDDVEMTVTRNYGETANDKATKLIQKLLFATLSVVVLVFIALGKREAAIVGTAVILTLTVTLFASWAWGFTLNRVSLFALIFSIGILVDDAIVVVENIHRHQKLFPGKTLKDIIPGAVDEVGGPTILATFTVIAALLPMAFVSGLMGPYMSPIPINASMGMLLSLAIAFIVTPWLARLWMKSTHGDDHAEKTHGSAIQRGLGHFFEKVFAPLLDPVIGVRSRFIMGLIIFSLIGASVLMPVFGWVVLKMLPFDNKSEFQVIVDMPVGTPVERTAAVLQELGLYLATVPEVKDYQAYAGTASPINFNGLVRQYYLRSGGEVGDLQVNLLDKHHRDDQSHDIATRVRPALQEIGARFNANVKVVEVPPGPPVLAPIVAEIYGPTAEGRRQIAEQLQTIFHNTDNLVDIDESAIDDAPRKLLLVDRRKALTLGVTQDSIVDTLTAGLSGQDVTYLRDHSRFPVAIHVRMNPALQGDLDALLQLQVRGTNGELIRLSELMEFSDTLVEQPIYHKDMLPVNFVIADMAGEVDSPLYGMFKTRSALSGIETADGVPLAEYFITQPDDPYRNYSIKWDGEWQITYETFRDMGLAYGVGLILIYLLVVAQFGSYLTPVIIMAPIPLTVIGVMPGHALLGAQFTATSMIGMIALAGIIVRNSILLVDFINLQIAEGMKFERAIVQSAITRAQPIILTGLAAMIGAFFILDDPIFNGLAISLIFGILVSTALTLVVIPTLYYVAYRRKYSDQK